MKLNSKKIIYSIVPVIFACTNAYDAFGDTSFSWSPGSGSLKRQNGTNIPALQATILTYTSADQVVNVPIVGGQFVLSSSYGDDQFYRAEPNANNGRYTTDLMTNLGDSLVGRYVYAIILEMPFSSFTGLANVPTDGSIRAAITSMGRGLLSGTVDPLIKIDTIPPQVPQSFTAGPVQTTLQVIPEPAGVALIVLGAAAVAIRRRLKRLMA